MSVVNWFEDALEAYARIVAARPPGVTAGGYEENEINEPAAGAEGAQAGGASSTSLISSPGPATLVTDPAGVVAVAAVAAGEVVGLDTETTGLDPGADPVHPI